MAYACFISYRRPETDLEKRIVNGLHLFFYQHLAINYGVQSVFIDDKRLKYGDLLEDTLAEALHRSACMLMIYKPNYFDCEHTFCAREYRAMQEIEKERRASNHTVGHQGIIIPIILTCGPVAWLPPEIKQRLYLTIDTLELKEKNPRHFSQYQDELKKIVLHIIACYEEMKDTLDASADAAKAILPPPSALEGWLCELAPKQRPLPFRNEEVVHS